MNLKPVKKHSPLNLGIREKLLDLKGSIPKHGPNFFVAGTSRSGSTYLYQLLKQHPDIFMPETKELHYFDKNFRYRNDLKGYRSLFKGYNNEPVVGEVTPFYFYAGMLYDENGKLEFTENESAISRIHKHFPEASIIVSLRNPMDRLHSMYKKNYYQGKYGGDLNELLKNELNGCQWPNLLYRSRYKIHLENILQYFPRSALKILIFEEWTKDYAATLKELSSFLRVKEISDLSDVASEAKNVSDKYENKNREKFPEAQFELSPEIHEKVMTLFESDREYVEQLIGQKVPWSFDTPQK